ncbi:HAD-IB family phosphatase [Candidatus Bipolaricaulota bacterium]|nr:HAD-IB family phosphatase [Candidatus Bipolaricaulota bacterium]
MPRLAAVIFDLDGTLVRYHGVAFESSWGAIAAAAGVLDASDRLLKEYLPRRDEYPAWVAADARLLEGVSVRCVSERIFRPPLAEGVAETVDRLRRRYATGVLSSGVELVAQRVRDDLHLDFAVANRLHVRDGRFTGTSETFVHLWKKREVLLRIAEERGWKPEEICYIGDHMNDVPVMPIVGLGIAVHAKDEALIRSSDAVARRFSEIPGIIERFEAGKPLSPLR